MPTPKGSPAASSSRSSPRTPRPPFLIDGQVQRGVARARRLLGRSVAEAAYELGNGARVTAQDTVPFAVSAAATFLHDYPAALTACVQAAGDVDTTGRDRRRYRRRVRRGGQPCRCPWHPTRLAQPTRTAANVGRERAPVEGACGTAGSYRCLAVALVIGGAPTRGRCRR